MDRSASARRCESTASKSDAIRLIQPSCKQHGVGYVRSSAKANSKTKGVCSQGDSGGLLEPYGKNALRAFKGVGGPRSGGLCTPAEKCRPPG